MADVRDIFYHGVRQQVSRVLTALGPERVERGLTAFEDGHSNWSECFFARAFSEVKLYEVAASFNLRARKLRKNAIELWLADQLGFGENCVPIRIVWTLFDGIGGKFTMTKADLREFARSFLERESFDADKLAVIDDMLRQLDFSKCESLPTVPSC